jgi:hypothetical protein
MPEKLSVSTLQRWTTATNDGERVILEYDPAAQRYHIPGYSFTPALAHLLIEILSQCLAGNPSGNPEPHPEASPSVNV